MTSCGDKKTEAVRLAMQMEDDGYKMYIEGAEKTTNPLGKKMLLSLARDEEAHKKMVGGRRPGAGDGPRPRTRWHATGAAEDRLF